MSTVDIVDDNDSERGVRSCTLSILLSTNDDESEGVGGCHTSSYVMSTVQDTSV